MGKAIKFIIIFIIFLGIGNIIFGNYIKNKISLQEEVAIDLRIRGSYLKTKYVIRFSTEEKKENFKILSKEKDAQI